MAQEALLSRLPLDLGDGLVLRLGIPEDGEQMVGFHQREFGAWVGRWTRSLISGDHPTTGPADFTVVEDSRSRKIVSTVVLISQTWAYGGVPFGFGRPEIVVTDPVYRRRGLVRRQMELIHEMSAARGQLMLGITGFTGFYRQFGYEMALSLGGGQVVPTAKVERLSEDEPCAVRPARGQEDIALIRELHDQVRKRELIAGVRSEEEWAYLARDWSEEADDSRGWSVIETEGRRTGLVVLSAPSEGRMMVTQLELVDGQSLLNVMPRLLGHLCTYGDSLTEDGEAGSVQEIYFRLGGEHPLYPALVPQGGRAEEPRAWYIRIPDLVGFLRHVRPALERSLVGTVAEHYSGELKIGMYRSGVRLCFERGAITAIDDLDPLGEGASIQLPALTFLQVLCGRRRYAELARVLPECQGEPESIELLKHLFPRYAGEVWGLA